MQHQLQHIYTSTKHLRSSRAAEQRPLTLRPDEAILGSRGRPLIATAVAVG